ncbi:MAG: hypothetical protein K8S94_13175 [Planctomycetia bacterium]|nr:hypothetical protein [Planctomycetia bacterium]
MRSVFVMLSGIAVAATGCAGHKANQYAYAPPLAPPVYPQPQTAAQPVVYPGMTTTPMAVAAAPGTGVPMVPAVAQAIDPCCPPLDGAAPGVPVVYASPEQTPPCPAGP